MFVNGKMEHKLFLNSLSDIINNTFACYLHISVGYLQSAKNSKKWPDIV